MGITWKNAPLTKRNVANGARGKWISAQTNYWIERRAHNEYCVFHPDRNSSVRSFKKLTYAKDFLDKALSVSITGEMPAKPQKAAARAAKTTPAPTKKSAPLAHEEATSAVWTIEECRTLVREMFTNAGLLKTVQAVAEEMDAFADLGRCTAHLKKIYKDRAKKFQAIVDLGMAQ